EALSESCVDDSRVLRVDRDGVDIAVRKLVRAPSCAAGETLRDVRRAVATEEYRRRMTRIEGEAGRDERSHSRLRRVEPGEASVVGTNDVGVERTAGKR